MIRENINSRALQAINYLLSTNDLCTKTSMANDLGISASKLSEILGERMKAGTDVLAGLSSEYNISSQWLLTGEGNMVTSENLEDNEEDSELILPCSEEFEYINNDNGGKVPIVNELSFATYDPDNPSTLKAEEYYYIKDFRNADFMMRVAGDYMYPKYKPGDLIACRYTPFNGYYQWGKTYAILTCHQGILLGRVYEHKLNTSFVTLRTENSSYPEWDIPIDEIARSAAVIGSISLD